MDTKQLLLVVFIALTLLPGFTAVGAEAEHPLAGRWETEGENPVVLDFALMHEQRASWIGIIHLPNQDDQRQRYAVRADWDEGLGFYGHHFTPGQPSEFFTLTLNGDLLVLSYNTGNELRFKRIVD
ncbi:MAG: hypothetical protein AAGH88_15345 [Planctomycetota bacterium]